jgi:hypothetical protein
LKEEGAGWLFDTWRDPVKKGLAIPAGQFKISQTEADLNDDDPKGNFETVVSALYTDTKEVKEASKDVE